MDDMDFEHERLGNFGVWLGQTTDKCPANSVTDREIHGVNPSSSWVHFETVLSRLLIHFSKRKPLYPVQLLQWIQSNHCTVHHLWLISNIVSCLLFFISAKKKLKNIIFWLYPSLLRLLTDLNSVIWIWFWLVSVIWIKLNLLIDLIIYI